MFYHYSNHCRIPRRSVKFSIHTRVEVSSSRWERWCLYLWKLFPQFNLVAKLKTLDFCEITSHTGFEPGRKPAKSAVTAVIASDFIFLVHELLSGVKPNSIDGSPLWRKYLRWSELWKPRKSLKAFMQIKISHSIIIGHPAVIDNKLFEFPLASYWSFRLAAN